MQSIKERTEENSSSDDDSNENESYGLKRKVSKSVHLSSKLNSI